MSKEKSCHCRVRILYQKKLWLCYENIQRYQIYIYFFTNFSVLDQLLNFLKGVQRVQSAVDN